MLERGKLDLGIVEIIDTESLVPQEHLPRKIDAAVDFNRLYEIVESLYSEGNGRPSIDPVVLFKMVLIQHLYGLSSLRLTAEEISGSIYYRWFLGCTLQEETPHFSTVSCNFRCRFIAETVEQIFAWILEEIAEAGYLSPKAVVADSAYKMPHIRKKVLGGKRVLSTACKRPQAMKGGHAWWKYVYDEFYRMLWEKAIIILHVDMNCRTGYSQRAWTDRARQTRSGKTRTDLCHAVSRR